MCYAGIMGFGIYARRPHSAARIEVDAVGASPQSSAAALAVAWRPILSGHPQSAPPPPEPPQALFKDLFIAVQTARIYTDGKTFADATPKAAPERILARFHAQRPASAAALKAFVEANFTLPAPVIAAPATASIVPIDDHIDRLWSQLTRSTPRAPAYSSILPLPKPYVVPGGRFREIYSGIRISPCSASSKAAEPIWWRTWWAISRTSSTPTATCRTARGPIT